MCISWMGYRVLYLFDSDLYFSELLINSSFKKEDMTLSYHCCCKGSYYLITTYLNYNCVK